MTETKVVYQIDEQDLPFLVKIPLPPAQVTLADLKAVLKPGIKEQNYKYYFKSYIDNEIGYVKEEIEDDDANLPCMNGKVQVWLVSQEGSNVSDSNSQYGDSIAPSDVRQPVGRPLPKGLRALSKPLPPPDDSTCTETDSVISSRREFGLPGHHRDHRDRRDHPNYRGDKYSRFDGIPSKHHRSQLHYESSMVSSDLDSTTFLESDDDASSRITATTEHSSVSHVMARQNQRRHRRRKHRQPAMSRTSSFSSITDSTMSLNIITVNLNMSQDDNGPNFLGISIVGESNKGGDGGIYVGSIMKGGAVAKDGRIEPGDMILQVNDINFENMPNDEAVHVLRDVVQKTGPIKLVVAKCWDPNPKGYFTIPRTEPVRPIDPEAWVAHVAATGDYPPRPPSVTTITSTGSSLTSSIPETERTVEEVITRLTTSTPMPIIIREMQKAESGLDIRDRIWLKINIPNSFIGSDVVDWLLNHVEGFAERRDAKKFATRMLKQGFIRHAVNVLTFSEQCYYVFGDIATSLAGLRLRDDMDKESDLSETCGPLPPPSAASGGCWSSNPYSSSTVTNPMAPIYAPMPYGMTGGYESNAYSYPQEPSLHSGSGGSSNGSRRERQHLVRETHHNHGIPSATGFTGPMRSIDSDTDSNRSKKSGSSVLIQTQHNHNNTHQPGVLPSYANHIMMNANAMNHTNGDLTTQNYRGNSGGSNTGSGNPNELFAVM